MTKDEVLKLALEALVDFGWHIENCPQFPTWAEPKKHPPCTCGYDTAITALRQALAEPDMGIDRGAWDDVPDATKWVDELRGGDETEQEPVACKHNRYSVDVHEQTGTCYDCGAEGRMRFVVDDTAPPKREWQGLTYEEVNDLKHWLDHRAQWSYIEFARAIEAKLKEKNRG